LLHQPFWPAPLAPHSRSHRSSAEPSAPTTSPSVSHTVVSASPTCTASRAPTPACSPLVPGHEFVGVVSAVGAAVTKFRVGDAVAIGNIVDSCGECKWCLRGQESWCEEIPTQTYSGEDRHDGTRTFGGFSGEYVARDRFVYHRPTTLDPAGVAPLLCAGITVWDPLRAEEAGPGTRVGVAGIGGLGHLAVRLAAALG